jgi:hypothetical protein
MHITEDVVKEKEQMNIWQVLLWLQKNKTFAKDTPQKNMFVVHEHQMKLKLRENKNNERI